ncbi:helix-turn-helix domain-containing protein [Halioglobus sp.]|nr:helix-turn-helix domain-containing protein [Halioglobus sp.]
MHTAAAVLYPQALATSITLPMEILQAASQLASVKKRGKAQVRVILASRDRKQLRLASGVVLKPDRTLAELPPLDLLLLPAIWRNPLPAVAAAADWQDMLREQAAQGTRICSVGTGSYLLAESGLLSGKSATTHWNYFDHFSERYPEVDLKTRHLITQSDNIYCAGSVNSIADLMVHIIEEWFGSVIARAVETQFSPEIRRSFHAASYQSEADSSHHDEAIVQAQGWLQANLKNPVSIAQLAEKMQMSPRTLNRRFKKATGITPLAYLQHLRIAGARELLRHSNLAIGDIAWQQGIQDVSYFSQLFRRHCGITPLQYRETVRGKLFSPETS